MQQKPLFKAIFWKAALVALFFNAALCAHADTGKSVAYEVNDQVYEGYFVLSGQEAPLVVLIHDWDGLTDYEVKRAHMLATEGYSVFAADLFGKGVRPTESTDKRQHTGELYQDRAKMRRLLHGALMAAKKHGADIDNAVAMGYCFGGAAVLEWARSGANLKGFVTFHGGLKTPEGQDYFKTQGELLVLHGTADAAISMQEFGELADALESVSVPHEMITYGGAEHAFTVFDGSRYQKQADEKSWQRLLEFLERVT